MTRPCTGSRAAAAVAAAGLVLLTGCARPGDTNAAGPTAVSSPSAASSTPTLTDPGSTAATTGAGVTADPDAAASTAPYPRGRAGVPAGGLPAPTTRTSPDPLVVAAAALRVFYGSDTTLDTEPIDAAKRALPWLGGSFADAVAAARIVAPPGAVWNGWAAHRAHLVVTVTRGYDDGAPPDTLTTAHQQWLITQAPVGVTGPRPWTGDPVSTVAYLTLGRRGGRWAVTTLKEAP